MVGMSEWEFKFMFACSKDLTFSREATMYLHVPYVNISFTLLDESMEQELACFLTDEEAKAQKY